MGKWPVPPSSGAGPAIFLCHFFVGAGSCHSAVAIAGLPSIRGIIRSGGGDEELSLAAAGADVPRPQGGGRTDRGARDDAGAPSRRWLVATTSPQGTARCDRGLHRSEEHTSELQSL